MSARRHRFVVPAVIASVGVVACLVPGCGPSRPGPTETAWSHYNGQPAMVRGQMGASDGVGSLVFRAGEPARGHAAGSAVAGVEGE